VFVMLGGMTKLRQRQADQNALRGIVGARVRWRLRCLSNLIDKSIRTNALARARYNSVDYPNELAEWEHGGRRAPKPLPMAGPPAIVRE
jgi:hypothetical protein